MNEHAIKSAIKQLIEDNSSSLVSGLSAGDIDLEIAQITTSALTPMMTPIAIGVSISRSVEYYRARIIGGNTLRQSQQSATKETVHDVVIDTSGSAWLVTGEGPGESREHFETSEEVWATYTDRVVQMLRDNPDITPVSGSYTIELFGDGNDEDRRIEKENRHFRDDRDEGVAYYFYTVIRFRVRACGEPNPNA